MADTMPIRIPVSLNPEKLEESATRLGQTLNRVSNYLKGVSAEASSHSKSVEELGREQERLVSRSEQLTRKLDDARKAYVGASEATDTSSDALARLATKVESAERALEKNNAQLERTTIQAFTKDVDGLYREMAELDRQAIITTASMRAEGDETGAAALHAQTLAAKHNLLTQATAELREQIERAKAQFGETSSVVMNLSNKLNNVINDNVKLSREINTTTNSLNAQAAAMDDSSKAMLSNITQLLSTEAGLKQLGDTLTNNVTKPLLGLGRGMLDAAVANQAMESSFNNSFKTNSETMRKWSEDLRDNMDVNEYKVREMMASWKDMFSGMEIQEEKQNEMIRGLTELAYDLAALYNKDVSEVFENLQSGLNGSAISLRKYGIFLSENAAKTEAWRTGIARAGEALTEGQKITARYEVTLKQSSNAQSRWNEEANDTAGKLRTLTEKYESLQIEIGEKLLPVLDKLATAALTVLNWFDGLGDSGQTLTLILGGVAASIGPVLRLIAAWKALRVAKEVAETTSVLTKLNNFMGFEFSGTMVKIVAYFVAIAAAIAVVLFLIAVLNGSMSKTMNDFDKMGNVSDKVANAASVTNKLPQYASGTNNHPGGRAIVGEEGPEVVDLPAGSKVYTAKQSRDMMGSNVHLSVSFDKVDDVAKLMRVASLARRTGRQLPEGV